MNFLKKYWQYIAIGVLLVFSVTQCTGKGNYERKYKKMSERCVLITDSVDSVYSNVRHEMDSMSTIIKLRDDEIEHLKTRNEELSNHNRQLANKPVVVKIEK